MRVYVDMVADLFHFGHVAFLRQVRETYPTATLVVGIHSDAVVASYKRVPIMTLTERCAVVRACRYVDAVIPNAPITPDKEYITRHSIDRVIHGSGIDEVSKNKMYKVAIERGIYAEVPRTPNISTTQIIARINTYAKVPVDYLYSTVDAL